VLDVRIKRVDLPSEINNQVYKRMESERTGVANKLRSTGIGEAEQIKADAERQRTIILADAYRDAQKIKGEGDAEAVRITAAAFGRNPEFYSFYRSMDAYRESFRNKSDVMVLDTNSDFFKYLKSPGKGR
jgi:modulator of FtsH protease HflC